MMDWLLAPVSGAPTHDIAPWAYWHARAMVLGWGILIPLGALLARFFKVTPSQDWPRRVDSKWWWNGHRTLQYTGVAVISIGVWLAWDEGTAANSAARWHAWAGWALFVAAWAQVLGALLRGSKGGPTDATLRGDHYDMTLRRRVFELFHKSVGWLTVLVAFGVILFGLVMADAPRWIPLLLSGWWLALVWLFARLQIKGRCIDTYQAIWGPDPQHPGNRMSLPGWGVRRPLDENTSK